MGTATRGTETNIAIVASMARNGVIGNHYHLPWKLGSEAGRIRKLTQGATIVVGRKTYEHISAREDHPLADRRTVILTHEKKYNEWGRLVAHSWPEIVRYSKMSAHPVFVIGGAELFKLALDDAEKMYLTHVETESDGDARFPEWKQNEWHLAEKTVHTRDVGDEFPYVSETWQRRSV